MDEITKAAKAILTMDTEGDDISVGALEIRFGYLRPMAELWLSTTCPCKSGRPYCTKCMYFHKEPLCTTERETIALDGACAICGQLERRHSEPELSDHKFQLISPR